MNIRKIKNIFWDMDGVLCNLNHAYFRFLTEHPSYRDAYGKMKYEDLPNVLPIHPKYGALELSTHPTLGVEMNRDFCASNDFYFDRPLYPQAEQTVRKLHAGDFFQCTMSAGFDAEKKKEQIRRTLGPLAEFIHVEAVQHAKNAQGKENMMKDEKSARILAVCQKFDLSPEETALVDDRNMNMIAAKNAGVVPVRFRSEFTTDTPPEIAEGVIEVSSYDDLLKWLCIA